MLIYRSSDLMTKNKLDELMTQFRIRKDILISMSQLEFLLNYSEIFKLLTKCIISETIPNSLLLTSRKLDILIFKFKYLPIEYLKQG